MDHEHFKGKSAADHLKETRMKGALAVAEAHGTELSGFISAACDSAKDTSIALLFLWILGLPLSPALIMMDVPGSISWIERS